MIWFLCYGPSRSEKTTKRKEFIDWTNSLIYPYGIEYGGGRGVGGGEDTVQFQPL